MTPMDGCSGGSVEADHLCVLVHGLWGNPINMSSVAQVLRAKHRRNRLHILVPKRNSGSFTYDGIELGGERVGVEIEEELTAIVQRGGRVRKLSVVGYSLGGLVARYAIGLLHAKGALDELECMNFTAFASPFIGVRAPFKGWRNTVFNVLGARTLAKSGRQLFGIDSFRDTGRPLLAVLADPKSPFMAGLARFRRRTLYANIANDRSVAYYTASISKTDPYADGLSHLDFNFLPGYDDVLLDPRDPIQPHAGADPAKYRTPRLTARRAGFLTTATLFLPIGILVFLANALYQTVRSSWRVKLHEMGLAGIEPDRFRNLPLLGGMHVNELREAVEGAYESLGGDAHGQDYLRPLSEGAPEAAGEDDAKDTGDERIIALERQRSRNEQPTLALAPYQFAAVQALDRLGWRKYSVWIHATGHSHAAIIVRIDSPEYQEGMLVLKHWTEEEFLI